ncbi:SDR family NAD(P)-dependent oxidoreductase [Actinoplanes sp. LDG1-06]|uniref:SDR family NAD(P)-dependent oxidoreductase n=1 Tax=Paractinoplanes ovalisporus TaxID=2810368 RepID=A0ABS2AFZ9_9ACTN|nr:SDR family NAD(P)-dependent oxidoreductase [Actinoplanes ovalisporus]MBM2618752.1 SDR family NAD(P)-dependent oxidoreductase [Actinoplanes ovalisporus]
MTRTRTAVVTGAGGGLGRAITAELARRGYAVWATDIEAGVAEPAVDGLSDCRAAALDVTDARANRALAQAVVAERGRLDLWVNNAGILAVGYAWEIDADRNDRVLAVNATGTINGTNAALAHMVPAGRGQVINLVSMAGIVATPGQAVYAASKHAAMAYTLSTLFDLRRGGHRGIDVCAVCPSGVWTPLLSDQVDDPEAAASFTAPLLTADAVARVVGRLTERPRPVTIVPRRRGPMMRFVDLFPRLAAPAVPRLMRDARRRQERYRSA